MNWTLPFSKQYYIDCLLKEREVSPRKLKRRYPELVALIKPMMEHDNDFGRQAYLTLYDYTSKCANPVCAKMPKFDSFDVGYRTFCSSKCNAITIPKGFASPVAKQALKTFVTTRNAAHDADIQKMIAEDLAICIYCGGVAKFYSKQNETWRCKKRPQDCPKAGPKRGAAVSAKTRGVPRAEQGTKIDPQDGRLCSYGCGRLAQFQMSKWSKYKLCCSTSHQACIDHRDQRSAFMKMKYKDPVVKAQFLARLNQSLQNAYGVNWMIQIPGMVEKRRALCEERYGEGIYHPSLAPHLYLKNVEHLSELITHSTKSYILPSGRTIKVRGFEDMGFDDLLALFDETEISSDLDPLRPAPTIRYEYKGANRIYQPDFYIKSINTIIEVKSVWTYIDAKDDCHITNKLKEAATIAAGYEFVWMIYSDRRSKALLTLDEIAHLDRTAMQALAA